MNNSTRRILKLSFLFSLFSFFSISASAQPFSLKDRLGKWESTNRETKMEFIFIDSSRLQMKRDVSTPLNNTEFIYAIDTIGNQKILTIHFPAGAVLKLFLWVKSNEEIKMLAVDIINYKDPMKDLPDENNMKVVTFRKVHNVQ